MFLQSLLKNVLMTFLTLPLAEALYPCLFSGKDLTQLEDFFLTYPVCETNLCISMGGGNELE